MAAPSYLATKANKLIFLATLAACHSVCQLVCHFGPDWNISTTTGWIALTFYADIHGALRMNHPDFDDPDQTRSDFFAVSIPFSAYYRLETEALSWKRGNFWSGSSNTFGRAAPSNVQPAEMQQWLLGSPMCLFLNLH